MSQSLQIREQQERLRGQHETIWRLSQQLRQQEEHLVAQDQMLRDQESVTSVERVVRQQEQLQEQRWIISQQALQLREQELIFQSELRRVEAQMRQQGAGFPAAGATPWLPSAPSTAAVPVGPWPCGFQQPLVPEPVIQSPGASSAHGGEPVAAACEGTATGLAAGCRPELAEGGVAGGKCRSSFSRETSPIAQPILQLPQAQLQPPPSIAALQQHRRLPPEALQPPMQLPRPWLSEPCLPLLPTARPLLLAQPPAAAPLPSPAATAEMMQAAATFTASVAPPAWARPGSAACRRSPLIASPVAPGISGMPVMSPPYAPLGTEFGPAGGGCRIPSCAGVGIG